MIHQCTLKEEINADGIGLHSGEAVSLRICPAAANSGIVFRRSDLANQPRIVARVGNVVSTTFCTVIGGHGIEVGTIEHLMSAFAGLGVDNALVDVSASELPVMDGSSTPFVKMINTVGLKTQGALRRYIKILRPLRVSDGDKFAELYPYPGYRLAFDLSYQHPFFDETPTTLDIDLYQSNYCDDIAHARTYGFLSDYEKLKQANLAKGGSLDNAVVIGDRHILNSDGLRYPDEPVRHKILDAIGDLYLLGHRLVGGFRGYKSGHTLNYRLIKALLAKPSHWHTVTAAEAESLPPSWLASDALVSSSEWPA